MLYGANGVTDSNPEVAASSTFKRTITSGGGFSRSFAQADYQQNAVSYFLTKNPPGHNSSQFNINGRAYPDVSANGAWINAFSNNKKVPEFDTNASTPIICVHHHFDQ
ncbi:hypothetical protein ABVK25_007796 [Lepraria finkii]|uniref:Uncharacterized protein n=1 Tax=Lepraria finkii TaxID=1340010 RepID=A0ABR4B1U4_9LECA